MLPEVQERLFYSSDDTSSCSSSSSRYCADAAPPLQPVMVNDSSSSGSDADSPVIYYDVDAMDFDWDEDQFESFALGAEFGSVDVSSSPRGSYTIGQQPASYAWREAPPGVGSDSSSDSERPLSGTFSEVDYFLNDPINALPVNATESQSCESWFDFYCFLLLF